MGWHLCVFTLKLVPSHRELHEMILQFMSEMLHVLDRGLILTEMETVIGVDELEANVVWRKALAL